jgi:hypothetical protein
VRGAGIGLVGAPTLAPWRFLTPRHSGSKVCPRNPSWGWDRRGVPHFADSVPFDSAQGRRNDGGLVGAPTFCGRPVAQALRPEGFPSARMVAAAMETLTPEGVSYRKETDYENVGAPTFPFWNGVLGVAA